MREIVPGIFHWSTFHAPIRARVSSYYVQPAGVVIDPKVPEDGLDALPGRPQQVVLTSGPHGRDARVFAETFGIPVRASHEGADHLGDALEVEPYGDHEEIAPGVHAVHIGNLSADEGALHIAVGGGKAALREFVTSPVGHEAYGQAL